MMRPQDPETFEPRSDAFQASVAGIGFGVGFFMLGWYSIAALHSVPGVALLAGAAALFGGYIYNVRQVQGFAMDPAVRESMFLWVPRRSDEYHPDGERYHRRCVFCAVGMVAWLLIGSQLLP